MITLIIVLSLIIVFLLYKLYEHYKEKETFKNVKWCVYFDSFRKERPEARMRNHIFHLQHELSLDQKYLITKDELDTINDILLSFRQNVIQEYFSGSYHVFSFETNLCYYLEKHQDEYEYRYNITYHKMYYILQLHDLKLHNIVNDNNLGVITAKATKETIDNILSK